MILTKGKAKLFQNKNDSHYLSEAGNLEGGNVGMFRRSECLCGLVEHCV